MSPPAPAARPALEGADALAWEEAERALVAARDPALPPLARAASLARVSELVDAGVARRPARAGGASPRPDVRVHALVEAQYRVWAELAPALAAAGAAVPAPLDPVHAASARAAFRRDVFPALTPVAIGPGCPSPRLVDGAVELAVLLEGAGRRGAGRVALVRIPAGLPRLVPLAARGAPALLEDLVAAHVADLFPGDSVAAAAAFRATVATGPGSRRARRSPEIARIELAAAAPEALAAALVDALRLAPVAVFFVHGPLRLQDLAAAAVREGASGRLAG